MVTRDQDTYLAIDFGGTKIAAGVVDHTGALLTQDQIPTQSGQQAAAGLESLLALVRTMRRRYPAIQAIGIGICCQVDPSSRALDGADDTIPGWQQLDFVRVLERQTGLAVSIDNDANAAALGEGWTGAARGLSDYSVMTVGTGVGGGVVVNGALLHGAWGGAGEFGHMPLNPAGPACYCGGQGCLELLIAGPALTKRAQQIGLATSEELFAVAAQRPDAAALVTEAGGWLTVAALLLLHVFQPEAILFGGGVMRSAWSCWEPLLLDAQRRSGIPSDQRARLGRAALGQQAGLIGAAALARASIPPS